MCIVLRIWCYIQVIIFTVAFIFHLRGSILITPLIVTVAFWCSFWAFPGIILIIKVKKYKLGRYIIDGNKHDNF